MRVLAFKLDLWRVLALIACVRRCDFLADQIHFLVYFQVLGLFYFFKDFSHLLVQGLTHTSQSICVALVVIPLLLCLNDIKAFWAKGILRPCGFCVDPEIEFVVRRRLFSPPFLVLNSRSICFIKLRLLRGLSHIFIIFMTRFLIFVFFLSVDFLLDLLFQLQIFLHFLSFLFLFPPLGFLHLHSKLFLVLVLFPGLVLSLLRIHNEQTPPESFIVGVGDF